MDDCVRRVLRVYPDDCQPSAAEPIAPADSFSGARLWRLATPRGPLSLRRWPRSFPTPERLEFIQAVLWHVEQEGFRQVPVPVETRHRHGFVRHEGHLWELVPWLRGQADYHKTPSTARLQNAMTALARFHHAARSFPLPDNAPVPSPGIVERRERLRELMQGGLRELREAISDERLPELAARATETLVLAEAVAPSVAAALVTAAPLRVLLQPCIRDIWSAHVLFEGEDVTGLVDFGSMRAESVAADVARLLGSLAGDDRAAWHIGIAAYTAIRSLSEDESRLVCAFDRSTVLMAPVQWLEWIYLDGREFANPTAVLARYNILMDRLAHAARSPV